MKAEIKVPSMGESITEAVIGELLKNSGDPVEADEEILELETDKVNQVIYAPESGVLHLNVSAQETVKIGQVIGFIDTEGAPKKEKREIKAPAPEPKKESKPVTPKPAPEGIRKMKETVAKEIQTEVSVREKPSKPSERRETRTPMSQIRKVIASRLLEAQNTTAMLTTFNEVDMSKVIDLRNRYRDRFQETYGMKLGFMSFFVKAVVSALRAVPEVNSYISGDEIVHREYFDLGIAVSTERGLIVPVIRDCDRLSFAEIESKISEFAEKARKGGLSVDDLKGGGFTITNGGVFGSLLSTPILNPPQSGILGMHKIEKRAVVRDDQIVIRPMMYLALSYDHRVIDGKEAVTFLVHIKDCIEDPTHMLLFETHLTQKE